MLYRPDILALVFIFLVLQLASLHFNTRFLDFRSPSLCLSNLDVQFRAPGYPRPLVSSPLQAL